MKIINRYITYVLSFACIGLILLLDSCGGGSNQKNTDTPTSGRIKVGVDDSYRLLVEAEMFTFEAIYKYTSIDPIYNTEADVINDFMNDSVPMIIVNRELSDQQVAYLRERQYIPKTIKVAIDAVAFIVNNDNPDTALFYQTVKEIFEGKITSWDQINNKSRLKELKVVFDNFKSGNPRYLKEKFELDSFPPSCFAAKNNADVINYVEKNINAIGVISVNWISDPADSVSHNFLKRFKVVGIALEGDNNPGTKFYRPFPGYIAERSYPFTREVYCINRQSYTGLAHGFSSFIAGEKGQFIVLRSGMVPAAMPVRLIELKR
ncbi:MAG: substrate-binding domain-containing protein [Bacteroidales bacterium]|nr:substrate-binding domain-containing protein [Bacteroidales bacterium]